MAQQKWKLNKLYGALESTFGVDPSASGSLYKALLGMGDMTFQPEVDVVAREGMVNDMSRQPHVIGAKRGKLAFKLYMKGSGTPGTSAVAAIAAESDGVLQSLLGTVVRGTGDVVQASSTTTVVNVVTGANFSKGMMIAVPIQDGTFRIRAIASIASNALTLARALPTAALTGGAVVASSRYTRANTGHVSMAFNATRHGIEYTFTGCKLSAKIAGIGARGSVMLDVTSDVADWLPTTKASLPTSVPTGITAVRAPAVKGAPFSVAAAAEEPLYSLDFDFGVKFEHMESTAGAGLAGGDGVVFGMELVDAVPAGVIKAFYASQHFTDYIAGTENSLEFCSGVANATVANAWGLYIPKAQYTTQAFEDKSGVVGENLPFAVNDNGVDPEFYLSVF